jgi:hypothetical protein
LAGEGGGLSPYAQSLEGGRSTRGGSAIVPLTPAAAREWLDNNNEAEALEVYFASEIKDA